MTKKSLQQVIKENKQFGFDPAIIQIAYANVNGQADKVIQEIFRLQSQSTSYPTKPGNPQDEDAQLSKAIQMSINQAKDKKISLQPLNPQQRVRKSGIPVGLKNIGNTCYFNSLLQTYFQNAIFVRQILKYEIPSKYLINQKDLQKHIQNDYQFKRKLASCKLVDSLKLLFMEMIASDRKYIDPTKVLSSIVDDYGNQLPVGDQKDIGQFNLIFLSRIDQGLNQLHLSKKMQIEHNNQKMHEQSPSKLKVIGGSQQILAQNSLLKNSSIKISEDSIITQQFIGKIKNTFHNESSNFHKEETQLFSLLFVDVKNKQLYQALEEVVMSNIDDYRNQKGQVVGVQKRTWIHQAPKTLFFQINRVSYDKEKQTLHKINDNFDFPKEFYIDPFLSVNKKQALQIQSTVKKLRKQRQSYIEYLQKLQHYGDEKQNLLKTILTTQQFFKSQLNKMQIQDSSSECHPLVFNSIQKKITPEFTQILSEYANAIEKKAVYYKQMIQKIDSQIQRCYESIRTQPYYLYSILIHQGSAEMGHYYSYIFDIESKIWRKYNDINISQQSPQQVFKQAKGLNTTSAYYLVYAQRDILTPFSSHSPMRNYKMSTDDQGYLKDYYSSFLSQTLRDKVIMENHSMYAEIQNFKMGSFATRVIDSYTKKFEICNETFRKTKPTQKKKNSPPILINLPLFVKDIDQNQYKNALMEHCIQEYGPKQYSPAFEQILTKKLVNFNEHKRPKKFISNSKYFPSFMQQIYMSLFSKQIFVAIKESSYNRLYSLLKQLISQSPGSYFNWLANLLSKTIVVHLLIEAENKIAISPENALEMLKLMTFILFKFINLDDEKVLLNNCVIWLTEISIAFKNNQNLRNQSDQISQIVAQKAYKGQFDQLFLVDNQGINDIKGSIELADACWNLSRTEDVYINQMLAVREQVKQKIQAANQIYREMKKSNLPLQRQQRQRIKYKKRQ